jgi:hypothetical protein
MTNTSNAIEYFDRMYEDHRWLGWGYLGERSRHDSITEIAQADEAVMAATAGWTDDERFHWANSKYGRWVGEGLLNGVSVEKVRAWGYFVKVKP